jgi:AcrR family transcriptional regulator
MRINLNDPRVRKTRQNLREAFVSLILQKGYDAISIQDIATAADTPRVTFYRHYLDKEDLLTDCLNTLYKELVERTPHSSRESLLRGYSPVQMLYEHIEEQETLYRILFSSRGTQVVIERLRHHLAQHAITRIADFSPDASMRIPAEIIAQHAASAQIGLAMWWLDQGKPYPPTYMAQISIWLSLGGVMRALGVEHFPVPAPQPL